MREGSILEESTGLLFQSEIFQKELGTKYSHSIVIHKRGVFVPKYEEKKVTQAENKISGHLHYILIVNKIEQDISNLTRNKQPQYRKMFKLIGRHLAYYGLAKKEADAIFLSPKISKKSKIYIEKWRNNPRRWVNYDNLWQKISKSVKIPERDLHFLLLSEVAKLLKGEYVDLKIIKERKLSNWSLVYNEQKILVYPYEIIPVTQHDSDNTLKGQVAYSDGNIITGIVGRDILVARMTHPDMIVQIRNSKAVITDEGGILSHAAIICREFKIPCVVGTKLATQKLRQGVKVQISINGVIEYEAYRQPFAAELGFEPK